MKYKISKWRFFAIISQYLLVVLTSLHFSSNTAVAFEETATLDGHRVDRHSATQGESHEH